MPTLPTPTTCRATSATVKRSSKCLRYSGRVAVGLDDGRSAGPLVPGRRTRTREGEGPRRCGAPRRRPGRAWAAPRLVRRRASTADVADDVLALLGDEEVDEAVEGDLESYQHLELPWRRSRRIGQAVGIAHGHHDRLPRRSDRPTSRAEHLEAEPPGAERSTVEGPGQRLVEVAQVEGQVPLGRRPEAEVQDVGITAELDLEPGVLGRGEVGGHDRRGPAVEVPGCGRHASVADGDQLRDAVVTLGHDDLQCVVGAPPDRVPPAEGPAANPGPRRTTGVPPLINAGAAGGRGRHRGPLRARWRRPHVRWPTHAPGGGDQRPAGAEPKTPPVLGLYRHGGPGRLGLRLHMGSAGSRWWLLPLRC